MTNLTRLDLKKETIMKKTMKLIERGLGGISAQFDKYSNLSSYYKNLEIFIKDHLNEIDDKTVILDKTAALENNEEAIRYVINGPMVDVSLPEDEVSPAPEIPDYMVEMLQGSFKSIAVNQKTNPGSLDMVSLKTHVDSWVKLGARVGKVVDGKIIWS